MIVLRPKPEGFKRLRTITEALALDDGDRSGPVLRLLDSVHRKQAREAFTTQGASTGSAWKALNPVYAKWKAKAGYGRQMLRMAKTYRTREPHQLFRGFTLASGPGNIARWVGGLRYQFGIADDVAAAHEFGEGNLPRRTVIQKTPEQHHDFVAAFVEFWRKRIRQVVRHA